MLKNKIDEQIKKLGSIVAPHNPPSVDERNMVVVKGTLIEILNILQEIDSGSWFSLKSKADNVKNLRKAGKSD